MSDQAPPQRRLSTAIEVVRLTCALYAGRPCVADLVPSADGEIAFAPTTFGELWRRVVALASAWCNQGLVAAGERVVLCGEPSVDWLVADLACLYAGAVSVPLLASAPFNDLEHILAETAPVLFVCSPATAPLMRRLARICPSARALMVINARGDAVLTSRSLPAFTIGEIEATPGDARPPIAVADDALVTIMYTSGGTGRPKGVPFSDAHWRRTLSFVLEPRAVCTVSYLPLCHVMGRVATVYYTLLLGGTSYFVPPQDLSLVLRASRVVRPTFLSLIPALSNVIYQQYRALVATRLPPFADARQVAECEATVIAELRTTLLGDRLRTIRCGSAPTAPEVLDFLSLCFAPVQSYYSSTELGAVIVNHRVLAQFEYKLADAPELGYTTRDHPYPRGELLVRSPHVMRRYFERPEATAEYADADGFVRTGDIFEERAPRHVVWIDRKSTVMRLAHGEFVALTRLEHLFSSRCPAVRQIFLYGNAHRDHLLAIIVPCDDDPDSAALKRRLRAMLDDAALAAKLSPHEVPRDFIVEREPFTVENNLLTEVGKLRRQTLKARYEPALEALYVERASRRAETTDAPEWLGLPEKLLAAVASTLALPPGDVDGRASFVALGGDSLGAVSLCARLETMLGAAPPVAAVLDRGVTLWELGRRLLRQLEGGEEHASFTALHADPEREVRADELRLDRFLGPAMGAPRDPAAEHAHIILLTGANGFLGRFLLLELLERVAARDGRVVALVRAPDTARARARLVAGFAASGAAAVERFETLARDRLDVCAGDLMRPRFGLPAADYDALADRVDAVLHNGALVNHSLSYRQLFLPNVVGTIEALRFALRRRLKAVSFISSSAIAAGMRRTAAIEEHEDAATLWPTRPTGAADDVIGFGYGTSKWAGEVLLREFGERTGASVTIFRCGPLLGHSTWRGQINRADALTRLLASIVTTGLAPRSFFADSFVGSRALHAVPVDQAAAVIAAIALDLRREPRLFHVTRSHGPGLTLDDIVGILERAGRVRMRVSRYGDWFAAFRARLSALDSDRQRMSALPIIERWRHPLGAEIELDARRLDSELQRLTGAAVFPSLTEADVLAWLRDLDAVAAS